MLFDEVVLECTAGTSACLGPNMPTWRHLVRCQLSLTEQRYSELDYSLYICHKVNLFLNKNHARVF